jgi:hypothetical protein
VTARASKPPTAAATERLRIDLFHMAIASISGMGIVT